MQRNGLGEATIPRNGSGTMSVSNSFSSGNEIQSSPMNANFTDVASEITNSLPRDGQAAMTGQLKAANGTTALPSITFGTDTNTGFFRKAGDDIGISCGGAEVANINGTAATFAASNITTATITTSNVTTANITTSNVTTANITTGNITTGNITNVVSDSIVDTSAVPYDKFPSGTLMLFQQTTAPTGWTKQTTHNDKALRVVSGTASSGGSVAFTTVFGITATDSHTLTIDEMPAHNHGGGNHNHTITFSRASNVAEGGNQTNPTSTANTNTGNSGTIIDTQGGGSGHSHNIDLQVQYVDLIIAAKD